MARRSASERVGVRSPNGKGRGVRAAELAAGVKREVAEEGEAVAAEVVMEEEEEKESLLEWPRVRSLKRDAIVALCREREREERVGEKRR